VEIAANGKRHREQTAHRKAGKGEMAVQETTGARAKARPAGQALSGARSNRELNGLSVRSRPQGMVKFRVDRVR